MEIVILLFGFVCIVYMMYFSYNVLYVLPKRGVLFMSIPFCSTVWQIVDTASRWQRNEVGDSDELLPDESSEDYNYGYKNGYDEGNKDGRVEGFAEAECGPLVADLLKEMVDRRDFAKATWLMNELESLD